MDPRVPLRWFHGTYMDHDSCIDAFRRKEFTERRRGRIRGMQSTQESEFSRLIYLLLFESRQLAFSRTDSYTDDTNSS